MSYQYLCTKHQSTVSANPCGAYNWWLKTIALAEQAVAARDFTTARVFVGTAFEIAHLRLSLAQDRTGVSQYAERLAEASRLRVRVLTQLGLLDEVEQCLLDTQQVLAAVEANGVMSVKSLLLEFTQRARALLQMLGRADVLLPERSIALH